MAMKLIWAHYNGRADGQQATQGVSWHMAVWTPLKQLHNLLRANEEFIYTSVSSRDCSQERIRDNTYTAARHHCARHDRRMNEQRMMNRAPHNISPQNHQTRSSVTKPLTSHTKCWLLLYFTNTQHWTQEAIDINWQIYVSNQKTSDVYIGTWSSHRPLCLCLSLGIRHFCTEQQHSVHCAACKTEYILLAFLHI